jgi:glycosyltransferase involved in cell wall biosynthesis
MKLSIITTCLNSEKTIVHSLNSVLSQSYKNIEHIIVDGGSTDATLNILKKYNNPNKKILQIKSGLYEAMNIGINNSKGKYIGILNSDDIFNSDSTISNIVKIIKKNKDKDIFLGDTVYFKENNFANITRYYSSKHFKVANLEYGAMPAHTAAFIRKNVFYKYGFYKENYKIAADFDFFYRTLYQNKLKYKYTNQIITRMRAGGISGKNLSSYFISSFEIAKTFNTNLFFNFLKAFLRIPEKINQFFNFNRINLNKDFNIKYTNFFKIFYTIDFRFILNIKKIDFNKNFILSAMNLAFLAAYIGGIIKMKKYLINWPDGIFSKIFNNNIKKIPGRKLLKYLKLPFHIKEILVIGNLSDKSKRYLEKLFKKKIKNITLGYGNIKSITRNLKVDIKYNQLVFITLPTPKQEQLAEYLSKINKYFKIICIGGSIAIASGQEKEVPKFLYNFEFLWRLQYESLRRIKRLIITLAYYIYGAIFKKLENKNILFIR